MDEFNGRTEDVGRADQPGAAIADDLSGGHTADASSRSAYGVAALILVLMAAGLSVWFYRRAENRSWAREQAMPEIARLSSENQPVAAFLLARKARKYLPRDAQLEHLLDAITDVTSVRSSPSGASVEIQDNRFPGEPWAVLGTTPLDNIRVPSGYLRWRVSKAGFGTSSGAPIDFDSGAGTFFVLGVRSQLSAHR